MPINQCINCWTICSKLLYQGKDEVDEDQHEAMEEMENADRYSSDEDVGEDIDTNETMDACHRHGLGISCRTKQNKYCKMWYRQG